MKTKKLLFAAAALTVLTACSSDDSPIDNVEQRVPVTLAYSTIDATETRAAQNLNEGTFASDESVKVRISNTGAGEWTDYTFTTGSAGTMTAPNPAPYYPAGSQNIDIVAYYPATAGETFTIATDQTADASYKASDLMFASVTDQAKQAEAVNLTFSHKMAKLCVNITAGQGVGSITSVSILNVRPTVSFNQTTGEVGEATGSATSIVVSNNGAALIPAQTIDGGLLSIVTDKGTATYSVASKAFAAGQLYTLNITVNLRAVGTTTAITGWTSEGTVTVNPVVELTNAPAGAEAVDLGLSVKWANMNVGATTETGYGTYFAWGETKPKEQYSKDNYMHYDHSMNQYLDIGEDISGTKYDAAHVNLGNGWRMPSNTELQELIKNCEWEWVKSGNTLGYKITGKNGNYIFLPAGGRILYYTVSSQNEWTEYWSSSERQKYKGDAYLLVENGYNPTVISSDKIYGVPIRPVKSK